MARSIGVKGKKEVKRLVIEARNKGLQGVYEIEQYVDSNISDDIMHCYESAWSEIHRLTGDLVMLGIMTK